MISLRKARTARLRTPFALAAGILFVAATLTFSSPASAATFANWDFKTDLQGWTPSGTISGADADSYSWEYNFQHGRAETHAQTDTDRSPFPVWTEDVHLTSPATAVPAGVPDIALHVRGRILFQGPFPEMSPSLRISADGGATWATIWTGQQIPQNGLVLSLRSYQGSTVLIDFSLVASCYPGEGCSDEWDASSVSITANAFPDTACNSDAGLCLVVVPQAFVGSVTNVTLGDTATIALSSGTLRVEAAGTYVEQRIVAPTLNGLPSYDQEVGGVKMTYDRSTPFCVLECSIHLGVAPDDSALGSLWTARLQVWSGPTKLTDDPIVIFFPAALGVAGN